MFPSARIRFQRPISESAHGNRRSGRRTQSALIRKRRNSAVPRPRPASRQTGHSPESGPNPISTANLRTSPRRRRLRQTIAARTQPEIAEYRGSLIITNQPHGQAHIDSMCFPRTKSDFGVQSPNQPHQKPAPGANRHPQNRARTRSDPNAAAYLDTPRRHAQKHQSGSELFHTRRYATYLVALRVAYRFYH